MNQPIPLPPRKWIRRIGLPVVILATVAALLVATSWTSLAPATVVRATHVVVREVETDEPPPRPSDGDENVPMVQAPGWVEADPYSVYAGALAEGVVEQILVLEGDRVRKGQPVATLVGDKAD